MRVSRSAHGRYLYPCTRYCCNSVDGRASYTQREAIAFRENIALITDKSDKLTGSRARWAEVSVWVRLADKMGREGGSRVCVDKGWDSMDTGQRDIGFRINIYYVSLPGPT